MDKLSYRAIGETALEAERALASSQLDISAPDPQLRLFAPNALPIQVTPVPRHSSTSQPVNESRNKCILR